MKQYFIIAVAAVAAMAACSKVEANLDNAPGNKITFQAANYATATKAGEVSVLNDFTAFKSLAYLHAEGIDIDANGNDLGTKQNFFGTGETITWNSTAKEWAPSHPYYWPKGTLSYVNFIGWYGTTGNDAPTISYSKTGSPAKWTATMDWDFSNSTVGEAGANLLYADMAWRYKDNSGALYKKDGVTEGVPMLFHHALAQINIKAYAAGDPALTAGTGKVSDTNAEWVITLENVKISKVYTDGTLKLTNIDPETAKTTNPWTGGWDFTGKTSDDLTKTGTTTVDQVTKPATGTTTGDVIAKTCVLPQDLYEDGVLDVKLVFDVRIVTTYKTAPTNPNTELLHKEISLHTMGTDAWELNHKYTYYLKIVPSQAKVLFDPALEADWSEVEGTEQTI